MNTRSEDETDETGNSSTETDIAFEMRPSKEFSERDLNEHQRCLRQLYQMRRKFLVDKAASHFTTGSSLYGAQRRSYLNQQSCDILNNSADSKSVLVRSDDSEASKSHQEADDERELLAAKLSVDCRWYENYFLQSEKKLKEYGAYVHMKNLILGLLELNAVVSSPVPFISMQEAENNHKLIPVLDPDVDAKDVITPQAAAAEIDFQSIQTAQPPKRKMSESDMLVIAESTCSGRRASLETASSCVAASDEDCAGQSQVANSAVNVAVEAVDHINSAVEITINNGTAPHSPAGQAAVAETTEARSPRLASGETMSSRVSRQLSLLKPAASKPRRWGSALTAPMVRKSRAGPLELPKGLRWLRISILKWEN